MKRCFGIAIGLILALAGTATAHYSFIFPEKFSVALGEPLIIGFHASDGFPASTQLPKRLQSATLHTAKGATPLPEFRTDGLRQVVTITPPKGYSIVTAINPARTETMKPDEFTDYLKEEGLTSVIEQRTKLGEADKPGRERYSMYLKSIVLSGPPDDGYKLVVGLPIEIVPEKDPYALKPGQSLPVLILVRGAPAAGLELRMAWAGSAGPKTEAIGSTGVDGRISVPIRGSGPVRLHAIHMERVTDESADWESLWATLTFEIR